MKLLTQDIILNQTTGGTPTLIPIHGPLVGITSISDVINRLLLFIVPLAGIVLFFVLVFGGFSIITSEGNPDKLKTGRGAITAALIGFALITFSFVIVKLIGFLLGLSENTPFQ